MTDAYNIAVRYLIDKYPNNVHKRLTSSAEEKLRFAKKEERKAITDNRDNYIESISALPESANRDDKVIMMLLGQYYYGIAAKIELKAKLIDMNLAHPDTDK